jgi:hypothetical protein
MERTDTFLASPYAHISSSDLESLGRAWARLRHDDQTNNSNASKRKPTASAGEKPLFFQASGCS